MADRERVIKALECCTSVDGCCNCPYGNNRRGTDHCQLNSARDALILLREQEPVRPQTVLHTGNREEPTIQALICGNCHKIMGGIVFNYCPWCGRKVKWDD